MRERGEKEREKKKKEETGKSISLKLYQTLK